VRVGVVSDTHGVLHPGVAAAFAGVGRILHAGDVGSQAVLDALSHLAPVDAVRGNADREPLASLLPAERVLDLAGRRVLLLHAFPDHSGDFVTDPSRADPGFLRRLDAEGIDVVCFGHSHRAGVARLGRALLVNPGGGGHKRFTLPRSVAVLDLSGGEAQAEILYLRPA
jgi:putative phosphoesterase